MTSRRGLVALVLLAGLGGYAWYDWRAGQAHDAAETERNRLFPFDAEQVRSLHLRNGEDEILIGRAGDEWAIQEPIATPADGDAVDRLLSSLLRATIKKRIEAVDETGDLDAAESFTEVEIVAGDGEAERRRVVRVGAVHPFTREYYGRLDPSEETILISADIGQARGKDLMSLRDRQLLRLQTWQMKTVSIETAETEFRLVNDGGAWHLEAPIRTPAVSGTVSDLLSHLGRLQALSFVDEAPDDLEPYGLDQPAVRLTLHQADWPEPRRIDFGDASAGGNRFVRRWDRAAVMEVEESIWVKLHPTLAELRSPELLLVERWELDRLEWIEAEESFAIGKESGGDWRVESTGMVADRAAVDDWIDALDALRAEEFLDGEAADPARFGLDSPRIRLRAWKEPAHSEDESEPAAEPGTEISLPPDLEILAGIEREGRVAVQLAGWPSVYWVPVDQWETAIARLADLKRPPAPEPVDLEQDPAPDENDG